MSLSRTWAIARKEFIHIYPGPKKSRTGHPHAGDPDASLWICGHPRCEEGFPGCLDRDRSQESLNFVHRFSASPYFDLRLFVRDEKEIKRLIDEGEVKMGLILPWDFSKTNQGEEKLLPFRLLWTESMQIRPTSF